MKIRKRKTANVQGAVESIKGVGGTGQGGLSGSKNVQSVPLEVKAQLNASKRGGPSARGAEGAIDADTKSAAEEVKGIKGTGRSDAYIKRIKARGLKKK